MFAPMTDNPQWREIMMTKMSTIHPDSQVFGGDSRVRAAAKGFTLIELLVVFAIMAILAAIAIPSISVLMRSGSDAQAYNLISAQLAMARSLAVTEGVPAGVHTQIAATHNNVPSSKHGYCFASIVISNGDATNPLFDIAEGFAPRQMPGAMALGELTTYFDATAATGGTYGTYSNVTDANIPVFCTLTAAFTPTGEPTTDAIPFNPNSPTDTPTAGSGTFDSGNTDAYLWNHGLATGKNAVTMFTLFDLNELKTTGDRADYLNEYGQVLPLNLHTGLLCGRE